MPLVEPGHSGVARIEFDAADAILRVRGDWTTFKLAGAQRQMNRLRTQVRSAVPKHIDASAIAALDTNGASALLEIAERAGLRPPATQSDPALSAFSDLSDEHRHLIALVAAQLPDDRGNAITTRPRVNLLVRTGEATVTQLREAGILLSFLGECTLIGLSLTLRPWRWRIPAMLSVVEQAGANALPIIGLLSFLLGVVIAYQGGAQLKTYGANIFVVELTTLTLVRELGPMMAAIIVAGRTGSAFAAEVATMRVREEVDALVVMGLSPIEVLVLPKLAGLVIALPLLTIFADAAGIFGGMVMATALLDVSMSDFVHRIPTAVSLTSFLIGLIKAPVFAAVIALVGCFQGFRASGGADSVGRQTTAAVVESIFLVIVIDAAFSITFSIVGI